MANNNIKLKSKAVREILNYFFKYQNTFKDLEKLSNKQEHILKNQNIMRSLLEQIFMNMGIREIANSKDNESLQEFYNSIRNTTFIIMK